MAVGAPALEDQTAWRKTAVLNDKGAEFFCDVTTRNHLDLTKQ
jgi:hypothetical protein